MGEAEHEEEYVPIEEPLPEVTPEVAEVPEHQAVSEQVAEAGQIEEQKKPHAAPTPKPIVPASPTDAELRLKEEAEKAKNQLIAEIKNFKVEDEKLLVEEGEDVEDPRVQKFSVQNPVKIGGHVKYTVTGVDDEGEFSEVRRFREFHALGVVMRNRWPGCYIPQIPEKKIINKSNE